MSATFDRVETERLLLRRPLLDDFEAFFAIHSDPPRTSTTRLDS